ncbi:GNAT family N-acetyltransferase [Salinicola tamaricis]|uniref:GNAT family N-acetyltransferase n=1 Tax=Salinicola tamaricis TaxID=1771309 RepID=UPI000D0A3686|nr:GNAT family N-acetyltransferase [Salinicola tamaricis]
MHLRTATVADYPRLIEVWEASVRATHDFLAEQDLQVLKPLILNQYFDAVCLTLACSEQGDIAGFSGVADANIEMLFIAPDCRGQGIGTRLLRHAIEKQGATSVDVNEQNHAALSFYRARGFGIGSRSPLDGQGKPYPLLHLQLNA